MADDPTISGKEQNGEYLICMCLFGEQLLSAMIDKVQYILSGQGPEIMSAKIVGRPHP